MTKKFTVHSSQFTVFVFIFSLFTVHCSLSTVSHAKVYIDITSPAMRKLPVSFSFTGETEAAEITEIAKNDLDSTGIFHPLESNIPGAEITVSINVNVSGEAVTAEVSVFDLIENNEVHRKKYEAAKNILRILAHSISNDIFKAITGQEGIFRTKLTYIVDVSGKKELHLMDWDGYNSHKIVAKGLTFSHSWSRDGVYIIYSSERDKEWSIYLMNLKNYRETMLFSSNGLNLAGNSSPDGDIAFSSSKDGSPEIYVMNADGTGSKKLTKSIGIDVSPVFSPDGSQIAFVSDRGGSPQIYIMHADGTGIRRLTFEGNYNTSPAWAPDGKQIAYVGRKNSNNQIFVVKLDTSEIRQLTDKGNNESPAFSPDGMFIAFDSDREKPKGIYVMRVNGEGLKKISPKGVKAISPKWSPFLR
ncbi:MAG: PD40 domain-containing protein [Nitrospirae bacterium]|nr:PD40 domain-containing protein [Nitrospirota bacterium]